jgi:enamine deaminase RidA (YjgF/YER057c/UK114 family)
VTATPRFGVVNLKGVGVTSSLPEERLAAKGIQLPAPPPALASYVGVVREGSLAFVSGHGPYQDGGWAFTGKVGADLGLEEAVEAARLVTLNILATLRAELGTLDRVRRIIKLTVFVNSAPDFAEQHLVANGASELLGEVFGDEVGPHARSAVGMGALPFQIAVEIEAVFAVD